MTSKNHAEDHLNWILDQLPSTYLNNSRKIIKEKIRKILAIKDKKRAAYLFQKEFGVDLDYTAGKDDGEPQKIQSNNN